MEFKESTSEMAVGRFHLNFSKTMWLGLSFLYHIQMKYPKTVYLTEQCQFMSHWNSVHSVRRGTKISKTLCPLYRNLTVYSVMYLKLKHVLTAFLSFCRLNAIQMLNVGFFVHNELLKGSYSYSYVDLDPLFVSVNAISLLFDRISWKSLQIMRK